MYESGGGNYEKITANRIPKVAQNPHGGGIDFN